MCYSESFIKCSRNFSNFFLIHIKTHTHKMKLWSNHSHTRQQEETAEDEEEDGGGFYCLFDNECEQNMYVY